MARSLARQLPLPGSIDETVQLQEEITKLKYEVQWQRSEMTALQEQLDTTKSDCERWRAHHRLLATQLTAAHAEIALLQSNLRVARHVVLHTRPAVPDWLQQELRRLLTVAHPDKWSAGQPATTLAHEVTTTINTLRQRLEETQA